jgi:hypothetical protein
MTEEKELQEFYSETDNELLQIIETQCMLLATIAEICEPEFRTYDDELVEMNVVKGNAYKVILAAQKKLLKYIKGYNIVTNDTTDKDGHQQT